MECWLLVIMMQNATFIWIPMIAFQASKYLYLLMKELLYCIWQKHNYCSKFGGGPKIRHVSASVGLLHSRLTLDVMIPTWSCLRCGLQVHRSVSLEITELEIGGFYYLLSFDHVGIWGKIKKKMYIYLYDILYFPYPRYAYVTSGFKSHMLFPQTPWFHTLVRVLPVSKFQSWY